MHIMKAFFKIAVKLRGSLIMYLSIFIVIGLLISATTGNPAEDFSQKRLSVAVFDADNTTESAALREYIGGRHDLVETENNPEQLWDKLYYHHIDYVLTIEHGYADKLRSGETEGLFTYSVDPQSYACEYLNLQLRQYVSTVNLYMQSGMDFDDARTHTLENLNDGTSVTAESFSKESNGANFKFAVFMRYMAYILPAIMITVLARIIIELRGENIRNRTFCSPIKPFRYNGQIILGSVVFSIGIWVLMVVLSLACGGFPAPDTNVLLSILHSLVFVLIAAGIAVLVSMCLSGNSFLIDIIANIVCLGMGFLCGVFVDQWLLGEGVLKVGRFLPAYWYVRAIDNLGGVNGAVFNSQLVWQAFGMEALFAAAIFAVSLVVARYKKA